MLTLYHAHHSTCSQKVRIVLAEKDLAYEKVLLDLGRKDQLDPKYLKLNPNGVVPTLVDGGDIIVESAVICEYLDEKYPEPHLTPEGIVERAHMRAWLHYIEEVPVPAIRVPSVNRAFLYRYDGLDQKRFEEEQVSVRKVRKETMRRMTPKGFSRRDVDNALASLADTCERMHSVLADGPWLTGERFTLADVLVIPTIDRMADLGLSYIWEQDHPRVGKWYERFQQRASFQATYYLGARLSEFLELRPLYSD